VPDGETPLGSRRGHVLFSERIIKPASYIAPLDLPEIFGRDAPVAVDLGCGDGSFLCALAQRQPDRNFLGIERLIGRVNATARKAAPLDNVRVLRLETSYAVQYLLPAGSIEQFYLLFPDPWPKRRHQRRRLVSSEFLASIGTALIRDGRFHVATDQRDYFDQIRTLATETGKFRESDAATDLPLTQFEKRFQQEGAPIYRVELRKVSPVR
jgi:tRNA (guanine-N7-)-methyltransferase